MMGPSDLNRLARWTPARQSAELARYARNELGRETLRVEVATGRTLAGFRTWLAAHRPSARPARLGASPAAVHFAETAQPEHRALKQPTPAPLVLLATPAMTVGVRRREACPEAQVVCEQ